MRAQAALAGLLAGWLAGCASPGPHASVSAGQRHLLHQARSQRIAAIDFDQASVRQIADYLAGQSTLLDPGRKGVAFAFPYPEEQNVRVTLHLRNVSLLEAIRALCDSANIFYRIGDDAVSLAGCHLTLGPLTIRSFRVSASSLARHLKEVDETEPTPEALTKLFRSAGVPFPPLPGCGIHYDASTQLLTVANDPESLALIGEIADRMNRDSRPTK